MKVDLYGDGIGSVSLVAHIGNDKTIVNSARVSFGRDNKRDLVERDQKLIKYLVKHKHTSTLEHNVVTLMFEVPLFVRSQHMRHRTWSYNEISRRYTDVDMKFYVPQGSELSMKATVKHQRDILVDPVVDNDLPDFTASSLVMKHHKDSLKLYNRLLSGGVCREQARGVLPQNLYTRYYATVNLNNLLKFIDLRLHEGAQWEIQQVAKACLDIATELWPFTVSAYRELRHEI